MKLLFDENLSARLIEFLSDIYPESEQALQAGLGLAVRAMAPCGSMQGSMVWPSSRRIQISVIAVC